MSRLRQAQCRRLREQFSLVERFAALLTQHDNVNDVLFMLTDQAAEIVGVTGAGVTLAQGGGYVCVSGTVTAVSDLERIVETTQQGPSIDAVVNERTVAITNLATDEYEQRWPTFVAQAKASSICSVAALPMMAHGRTIGALEMYDSATRIWTEEDTLAARILANIASMHIDLATERDQERSVVDQLQRALTTRIHIEQAKGVLAARMGLTIGEAFEILRQTARDNNIRLHEVCRQILDPYESPPDGR